MNDTKNEHEDGLQPENKASVKTSAIDTGKRIDIGSVQPKRGVIRRPKEQVAPHREAKPKALSAEPEARESEEITEPVKTSSTSDDAPRAVALDIDTLEIDETGDFAAMLAETEAGPSTVSLKIGDKVSGKVVHVGKEHSFVSLSPKLEAAIATAEFTDEDGEVRLKLGSTITAYIVSVYGGVTLSTVVAQSNLDDSMLQEALAKRIPVEGKITALNKGGFDVMISGKRAFCPVGQVALRFVEEPEKYVGRTEAFLIERIEEGGRNIVVSRKALLMREQREKALETIKDLEINKRYNAVITRVADFGAFADIGGLEGLIPRSEISYGHIERVSDAISSNDRVEVVVLSFELNEADPMKSRLSFSLKKAKEDPYQLHWHKIKVGGNLEGRVVRLEPFGAFVELFPGIDGLIHISELAESRVAHPKDVLAIGDPVSVRVLSVSESDKRIGLSLKEAVTRHKGDDKAAVKVERGQKASGVVSRIERYGVFVELDNGATALLPHSEIDVPKTTDLSRAFPIGQRLDVAIIDVDAQNRVRVSLIARKAMEERDSYLKFKNDEQKKAGSFGSFADLIKKNGKG